MRAIACCLLSSIQWIQTYTPNENAIAGGDGNLKLNASSWADPSSSAAWSNPSDIYNGLPTGEALNAKLEYYNPHSAPSTVT